MGDLVLILPSLGDYDSGIHYLAIDLEESVAPERSTVETTRIVRDSVLTRSLKALHENRCQICGYAMVI